MDRVKLTNKNGGAIFMRPMIFIFLFILGVSMILIPTLFVAFFGNSHSTEMTIPEKVDLRIDPDHSIPITVYRTASKTVETYPIEEYVRGVVAAEMPVDFELEALKAQAMAARTYIVKRILTNDFSDVPGGAMVTDTIQHQVFRSESELRKKFGLQYAEKIAKLNRAVNETMGQVITYEGQPITALFFSTSNGYTVNSEDYYVKKIPYLRSVPSPWDTESPRFQGTISIPFSTIQAKLKVDPAVFTSTGQEWIKVLEWTPSKRVKKLKIGDKLLTGREVRELLGLDSSSFTFEIIGDQVVFNTTGYGHGVGMSQYGANGMAKEGKKAEEIVKYYYTGVEVKDDKIWIKKQ